MFAAFELCRTGLVTADPKKKHRRTNNGCFECRRRKRKCDEQRPFCGSCRKIQSKFGLSHCVCSWPSSRSSSDSNDNVSSGDAFTVSCDDVEAPSSNSPTYDLSPSCRSEPTEEFCVIPKKSWSRDEHSPFPNPNSLVFLKPAGFASPAELRILDFLVDRFESFAYPVYVRQSMSLSKEWLSLATVHPPLAHAFLACGSALLSKMNSRAEEKCLSIRLHSRALRAVSLNLATTPEEILALAVLLLHICEEINCDVVDSHILHLTGAHVLMDSVLNRKQELTVMQHHTLEICIYHTAVSSTFNAVKFDLLPDDYISKRLEILGDPPSGTHHALLGAAPELFNIVFHVSQLRRKTPLTALDLSQTTQINSQLNAIEERLFRPANYPDAPADMLFTTQLYHLACTLLLWKVCDPSLRETEPPIQAIIEKAISIFDQLSASAMESPVIPWPLIIISCGAIQARHQARLRGPLETSSRKERLGSSVNAVRFLDCAWFGGTSGAVGLGLDALLDDGILSTICF